MRNGLLAVAALFLAAPVALAADPPLPPIVFQTQPVGRVFDDFRAAANIVGGEKAVKAFNEGLKGFLGEKGLEGIDIGRPFVGYVVLAPKPADITAVLAFPISGEKEFLDLCDRVNKDKLKADEKDKTLYHLPPLDPRYKAMMRFHERYAYIAYGANPAPHIDAKALVSMPKLYDPAEQGLIAARFHFDRVPLAVKLALPALMDEVKKTVFPGGFGLGAQEMELIKPAMAEIEKLIARYVALSAGAETLTARVVLDVPSGNLVAEAVLAGKPNSELARIIAAFKPTANKFGALLAHPDTVAGVKLRLPLFEPEIRNAAVAGLEVAQKEGLKNAPQNVKPLVEELIKGLTRTVKTGEFDIAVALRGPDKNDWYTAVGAVAFDDAANLGKEFKAYIEKEAPPEIAGTIKWDAAKAGTVDIHTWKFPAGGFFIDFTKMFGGDDCTIAFAFAPHGVFVAIGPDAIASLKDALAVKPAPSPVLDVVVNPARLVKGIRKINPNDASAEHILGTDDKLLSALSVTLEGGKELKATLTLNLKVLPRAMAYTFVERSASKPEPPDPIKK